MTAWSRGRTLLAGAALILLANGVALTGVWLNRGGEPESRLTLTERELTLPYRNYLHKENSGLALRLGWRVPRREVDKFYSGYSASGGIPEWLDAARMAELGFDLPAANRDAAAWRRYQRQQPREALLVLELAGPAWRQAVEQARENAIRHEAAADANAGSKDFANRAKQAREALEREEKSNSRLFAIDIGRDLAALRAKYPDRGRHMIVKGLVRPQSETRDKQARPTGYVSTPAIRSINVPFALRPAIESLPDKAQRTPDADGEPRYAAELVIGRRLEPWLTRIAPLPAEPPTDKR